MAFLWKELAYKRVSKFTPKKFYEIDPRLQKFWSNIVLAKCISAKCISAK